MAIQKKYIFFLFGLFTICIFVYSFFFMKEKNYFTDTIELAETQPEDYKRFPLKEIIPLIPASATQIKIIYKKSRIKNIEISFCLNNSIHENYIKSIKEKLHEYTVMNPLIYFKGTSITSQQMTSKLEDGETIYFKGTPNTHFIQIDLTKENNCIKIQTF